MGAFFRRVLALLHRSRLNRDLDDELAFHLAKRESDQVQDGLTPQEAAISSRRQFGNVLRTREQTRDAWVFNWVEGVLQDIRLAVRGCGRAPSFTAFVTLTLALGIGGTTAIFSAMYPVLLAPLPYPNADRVVSIIESSRDGARSDGTFAMYRHFGERTRLFDAIAVFRPWQPTITGTGHPERLVGQRVSWGYFRVLGVQALAGRDFSELEDRFRGPNVVILSDEVWRRHFRADPLIVGRDITLDDNLFTVVAVMPPNSKM